MEKLLVTVEDVKNELDINLAEEFGGRPKRADRWLKEQQQTVLSHIARYAYGGVAQVKRLLTREQNVKAVYEAIIAQIDYLSSNNFVQPEKVMNTGTGSVEPAIAPHAHQILLNAGLLYSGAGY